MKPSVATEAAPSTRQKLIEAAFRVVARDGLADSNVKAIAAEAGVTPGLLHYHFANKDALLEEAVAQGGAEYLQQLDSLIEGYPPGGILSAYAAFAAEALETHRDLFRVRLALSVKAMNDEGLAARLEKDNAGVRSRIALIFARDAGREKPLELDQLRARMVKSAFEGMMLAWLSQPDFPMAAVFGEWFATLQHQIAATKL
jgi:AcrR family transcriptional regulator